MALPTALLSDASRRWRGGELDCWRYERHRRSDSKTGRVLSNLGRVWLAFASCVVLSVGLSVLFAVLRCRELQLRSNSSHLPSNPLT